MSTPPPLAYAVAEDAADRLAAARRVFAWVAIGYALIALPPPVVALFRLAASGKLSDRDLVSVAEIVVALVIYAAMVVGGWRVLRCREDGLRSVRVAAIALALLTLASAVRFDLAIAPRMTTGGIAMTAWNDLKTLAGTPLVLFLFSFPLRRSTR